MTKSLHQESSRTVLACACHLHQPRHRFQQIWNAHTPLHLLGTTVLLIAVAVAAVHAAHTAAADNEAALVCAAHAAARAAADGADLAHSLAAVVALAQAVDALLSAAVAAQDLQDCIAVRLSCLDPATAQLSRVGIGQL